jgi:hypothetical protein
VKDLFSLITSAVNIENNSEALNSDEFLELEEPARPEDGFSKNGIVCDNDTGLFDSNFLAACFTFCMLQNL